jgi:hypothetical protein
MEKKTMSNRIKVYEAEAVLRKEHEWDKWLQEIPAINLPQGYGFTPLPPFQGAIARFKVTKNNHQVSVYLDCYNLLGFMDGPYWEIYPAKGGDTERYNMNDVEGLQKGIIESLEEEEK